MNHNKTLAIAFTTLTVALTGVVFGSTVIRGTGHKAAAETTKAIKNKNVNTPTETQQNHKCETAGETSGALSS